MARLIALNQSNSYIIERLKQAFGPSSDKALNDAINAGKEAYFIANTLNLGFDTSPIEQTLIPPSFGGTGRYQYYTRVTVYGPDGKPQTARYFSIFSDNILTNTQVVNEAGEAFIETGANSGSDRAALIPENLDDITVQVIGVQRT